MVCDSANQAKAKQHNKRKKNKKEQKKKVRPNNCSRFVFFVCPSLGMSIPDQGILATKCSVASCWGRLRCREGSLFFTTAALLTAIEHRAFDEFYGQALQIRQLVCNDFANVFAAGSSTRVDVILTPTTPSPPPTIVSLHSPAARTNVREISLLFVVLRLTSE